MYLLDADSGDAFDMDNYLEDNDEDTEFDWDSWLKQKALVAMPEAFLPHVHKKANLILEVGMSIEFAYTEEDKQKYWVAEIIMTLGPVVRLRYLGEKDETRDKWVMISNLKFRPMGQVTRCNATLTPPAYLSNVNVDALLNNLREERADSVLEYATFEHQQFAPGMKLEIEDELHPYRVWVGNILENYGGRLQIRFDTPNPDEPAFWLFYTSQRIHPFGWAKSQGSPWSLDKPDYMKEQSIQEESWAALLEMNNFNFEMECKISHIKKYKYRLPVRHDYTKGKKVEVVDPISKNKVYPATITHVFDQYYFHVQIDKSDIKFLGTQEHPYIFPLGWSASHGVTQSTCNLSSSQNDVLNFIKQEAEHWEPVSRIEITAGMKIEVVNPLNKSQMCVGTVMCVYDRYVLLVNIDVQAASTEFLFHLMSCEVFPLGWSKSTGHPIIPPCSYVPTETDPECVTANAIHAQISHFSRVPIRCHGTERINIHLNHRCFPGPFLSKSKLASLPKKVGPGPVKLVLLDVVKRIANLAYVQMRILRELEAPSSRTHEGRTCEELKVKYKKRVYKGVIEVATRLSTVESYCIEISERLQACLNLMSLKPIPECPLNCFERNRGRATKVKKDNTKQPMDYKSFIHKPLINPVTLINRTPFHEDTPAPNDLAMEHVIVYNKEKCLRKRKVNLLLEREKKRLKLNDEEETGSGKEKESEENNSGEDESRKRKRGRPTVMKVEEKPSEKKSASQEENVENELSIYQRIQYFERKKLPLPEDVDPINWTVDDVFQCVSQVPEIRSAAHVLKDGAIDGEALLLLHWRDFGNFFNLDRDISVYLCSLVQRVRFMYYVAKLRESITVLEK